MVKTEFVKVFGETPFIKVIDFLLDNYIFDYSKTEVAREVGISRITIGPIWKNLIKQKIIFKTKKVSNAILYRLDTKNPIIIKMRELDFMLSTNDYLKKEKSKLEMPMFT